MSAAGRRACQNLANMTPAAQIVIDPDDEIVVEKKAVIKNVSIRQKNDKR